MVINFKAKKLVAQQKQVFWAVLRDFRLRFIHQTSRYDSISTAELACVIRSERQDSVSSTTKQQKA